MGKQNTQKKIRDSSLKHPLSKECVFYVFSVFFVFFSQCFLCFFQIIFLVFPMFFLFVQGFFGLSLFLCFPACCTVRSTGFAGAIFFQARSVTKGKNNIAFFQGNLHKGMPALSSRNTGDS